MNTVFTGALHTGALHIGALHTDIAYLTDIGNNDRTIIGTIANFLVQFKENRESPSIDDIHNLINYNDDNTRVKDGDGNIIPEVTKKEIYKYLSQIYDIIYD